MDLDQARETIRTQHRAVLTDMRPDSTPQTSPSGEHLDRIG